MRGIAGKAWRAGLNVIRLNQRNCGGTEHLTPTLYHSGLSEDIRAVVAELGAHDGLNAILIRRHVIPTFSIGARRSRIKRAAIC